MAEKIETPNRTTVIRKWLADGDLSIEELMDLAHEQLDQIEARTQFADPTTWISVLDFADRVRSK